MPKLPEVHFRLKPVDEEGKCIIYMQFLYNGERLFFSFGEKIKKTDWSTAKERAKNKSVLTSDGEHLLNDLLENLEDVCMTSYKKEKANGIPTPEVLKQHLKDFLNKNLNKDIQDNKFYELIERFVKGEIKHKGANKAESTIRAYTTTYNLLKQFERDRNYRIGFDTINLDFYYKFVDYLSKPHKLTIKNKDRLMEGLMPNTIGTRIKNIKVFMNEAVDLGLTTNMQYKHRKFAVLTEETDAIYLTEKEIIKLYKHDFSNNKRLEQARDLFVFGCFTGLRFSDYSQIKPENVVSIDGKTMIKKVAKKTKTLTIIPSNPVIGNIFFRYGNSSPKAISNQRFNEYIKEACEKAGLTEVGRLNTHPGKALYESVSSHTCRRSFATNYYLQGFPILDLMKITGHKTQSSFLKYIKMDKLDAAKRLGEHVEKNWSWSELMMKVAS
jgi:integrase